MSEEVEEYRRYHHEKRRRGSDSLSDLASTVSDDSREPISRLESALTRSASASLERAQTALTTIRSRRAVPRFTHPLSNQKTEVDVLVDFEGPDDPYRPVNWMFRKKVVTTALYGFTTMGATFASSVFSPAVSEVASEFDVGIEVSTLGTALLLFGFGLGPLVWAPLSEVGDSLFLRHPLWLTSVQVYGRKTAVLIPYFLAAIFSFATAVSKDIQTVCITRFFTGFFGSAPITNTGGVLGDIWAAEQRGVAIVGYALAVVSSCTVQTRNLRYITTFP